MATTTANIADDWQHVDDSDNFSVISLPTSEDRAFSPSPSPARPAIPALSSPSDSLVRHPHQPQSERLTRNDSPLRDTKTEPDKNQDPEFYGSDLRDVVEPESSDNNQAVEIRGIESDTPGDQFNKILDGEINPYILHEMTISVVDLIPEVLCVLDYQPVESSDEIKAACESLRSHLNRLQGILRGYAPHWTPQGRNADIPIDPGLFEWLSKLKSELLSMRAMLLRAGPNSTGPNTPWTSEAKLYCKKLKFCSSQMDELMTIIQSDYEDFHTLHMPIISTPEEASCTGKQSGPGRSHGCMPPGSNLFHLRRELYELKDQIVSCLGEIRASVQSGVSSHSVDHDRHLTALIHSYQHIKESLDLMLSNHASDWIDYSMTGGLTYPEFCRLNTDTIRSLLIQLKEVTEDLFLERSKIESLRYFNDPDDLLHDDKLVIPEPIINTLRTIEEVLVSILQIRRIVS